jgi:UDP-N-acetylmuramoyl-L-alanyl-D-glutamate--2,6-diaminopimelate ligase
LESVYKTVCSVFKPKRLICLLGSQGGGRDKWKRPEMGKIAAKYCHKIILTNEDPYDENPMQIMNDMVAEAKNKSIEKIIDRKRAIKKAISLAKKGDAIILTGKGGEVWMCVEKGKKISWHERKIVEEILQNIKKSG